MTKYFFILTFVLTTLSSFSQKHVAAYIEIRGYVDALGNIYLDNISKPKKLNKVDSLIDYAQLKPLLNPAEPITVINKLSEIGWTLISVTQVSSDKESRPASPFMLYYFKKDFEL